MNGDAGIGGFTIAEFDSHVRAQFALERTKGLTIAEDEYDFFAVIFSSGVLWAMKNVKETK